MKIIDFELSLNCRREKKTQIFELNYLGVKRVLLLLFFFLLQINFNPFCFFCGNVKNPGERIVFFFDLF